MDLPEVVRKKIEIIFKHKALQELIQSIEEKKSASIDEIHSPIYHLFSGDLQNMKDLSEKLVYNGLDTKIPTLFISECVFIYLEPQYSDAIIHWAASNFEKSFFWLYEQIKPNDPFGSMMLNNLEKRGCPLLSIKKYPDLQSQIQRFQNLGWQFVQAFDMKTIYNTILEKKKVLRVAKLEMLDEFEEWDLIQEHYCIVWASNEKEKDSYWFHIKYKVT